MTQMTRRIGGGGAVSCGILEILEILIKGGFLC